MFYLLILQHEKCIKLHSFKCQETRQISDMIFDIVKYMITVELVAFLFSDIGNWRWYNFVLTIVAIIGLIALGFVFMNDSNDNKK